MSFITDYPYFKTTGISLVLHGMLVAALLLLGPFAAAKQPPALAAVELVSVPEPDTADTPSQQTAAESPPMAQPTPQTLASTQPLPPALPDESGTAVAQPVFAATTSTSAAVFAGAGTPGETGTVAAANGGGNGTQAGTQGNGGGKRTSAYPTSTPKPPYPQQANLDRWEGKVMLHCRIDTDGSVTVLSVLEGGRSDVTDATVQTVSKKWRYSPARDENGVPIATVKNIRVTFDLNDA